MSDTFNKKDEGRDLSSPVDKCLSGGRKLSKSFVTTLFNMVHIKGESRLEKEV